MVALHLPGVLVGTGALQVNVELRARFRCFHAAGIGPGVHAAQDFDHSLRAVADFVGFQTFIGYDRRLGLLRGAAGVHQEGFAAGLISFRRGQLDNFIHSGPEQLRGCGGIRPCCGQSVRHHLAFGEYHMALPVGNIPGGQHLKNRARQLAVTADGGGADVAGFQQQGAGLGTGGAVGIVPGIFLRVALVQFEPHLHRLIGCRQLGGHVGLYRSLQGDFFKHIPRRFPMLPDNVPPFAQGLGNGNPVFIRHHASGQRGTVCIVFVDVKTHPRNGIAVEPVGFGDADVAFGWLVFCSDLIGLAVFADFHFHSEALIYIVLRHFAFLHSVRAVGERRGQRHSLRVRGEHRHHLAVVFSLVRGQAADAGDGKLCPGQGFLRQAVLLHYADAPLDGLIGSAQIGGCIGFYRGRQLDKLFHVPGGVFVLPDDVRSFGKRRGGGSAVLIRGHDRHRFGAALPENIELHLPDGRFVQRIGFHNLDVSLCRFVLHRDLVGFPLLQYVDLRGEGLIHIVFRRLCFLDTVTSPGQPSGFGNAACVRGYYDAAACASAACGRGSRQPRDGKLRSGQSFLCQAVPLHHADTARDLSIGKNRRSRPAARDGDLLRIR